MADRPRLLIVDDDPEVRQSLQIWLRNERFQVFTAASAEQARAAIQNEDIAVCLVDLRLRSEDGLRLAAELRSLDEHLKIIIITGYPTYETAVDAMRTGIFDYLSKSTDNDAILRKIRAAVEERDRELGRKAGGGKGKANIVLIGHHQLVREGLENFFKENPEYRLMHTYHSFEYVKKNDFNLDAALLLVCALCNQQSLKDPENFFVKLKAFFPNARTVIINCDCPDDEKKKMLRRGVRGFFPPNISMPNLKKALDCILAGQIWISRELSHQLLSELLDDTRPEAVYRKPVDTFDLTAREIEILKALASGLSNYAISEKLFLSEKTVKTHTHNIFRKMEVKTRTQAVMKAMEFHII